jgi:2-haloacid dehalogenase
MDRWATFDCYGTLVDWETGIADTLSRLWPGVDGARLVERYHEIEPRVQELDPTASYRDVMARTQEGIGDADGLPVDPSERYALAESLPGWPVFPEVPDALRDIKRRGWRFVILSNTDPDLLGQSMRSLGVDPDLAITAADAGGYKPALGHWLTFRERTGALPSRHVHVAASLFHDIAPAAELGIPSVWINRLGESSDLPRAAELPDLSALPDTLDRVIAGG